MEIAYKNIPVGYTDEGDGPAVVLLHGFLENKWMWRDFTAPIAAMHHRVITIDLLGHGNTGCLGYVHSMEENAQLVHTVLHQLKLRKATLIGHSMGGYVALAFAELFPAAVKGLMLVNSTAREDSPERKTNRDRAIVAVKQNHTAFVRMSVGNLFSASNRDKMAFEIEHVKEEALLTPLQGIIASLEGMKIRKDRQFVLRERKFPASIVLGQQDEVLPFADTVEMANELLLDTVVFPDGHMSSIENKDALLVAIQGFLRKIK